MISIILRRWSNFLTIISFFVILDLACKSHESTFVRTHFFVFFLCDLHCSILYFHQNQKHIHHFFQHFFFLSTTEKILDSLLFSFSIFVSFPIFNLKFIFIIAYFFLQRRFLIRCGLTFKVKLVTSKRNRMWLYSSPLKPNKHRPLFIIVVVSLIRTPSPLKPNKHWRVPFLVKWSRIWKFILT